MKCHPLGPVTAVCQCRVYCRSKLSSILLATWHFAFLLVTSLEKMTDPNKALLQAALATVKCWYVVLPRILQKAAPEPGVTYQQLFLQRP